MKRFVDVDRFILKYNIWKEKRMKMGKAIFEKKIKMNIIRVPY